MTKLIFFACCLTFLFVPSYCYAIERINFAKDALVDCSDGSNPEYAVNGDSGRGFWEARLKDSSCWLEIDLGQKQKIDEIKLFMWCGGDKRHYQYFFEVSSDQKNWHEIVNERDNTLPSTPEGRTYKFSATVVRFVRLTVTFNNVNLASHVREIEIYGPMAK